MRNDGPGLLTIFESFRWERVSYLISFDPLFVPATVSSFIFKYFELVFDDFFFSG